MGDRQTILIADDSRLDRRLFRKALGEQYALLEAEDGMQALEVMRAHKDEISLVVSDLMMPVLDGKGLLCAAREDAEIRDIPILIATGSPDDEVECLKLGCWDFVKKPFNHEMLKFRIRNNIERRMLYEIKKRQVGKLERYVDSTVADTILKEEQPKNELRISEFVVMFTDIRSFTALSEHLEPAVLVDILNRYFSIVYECVKKYGGVLDKFTGDGAVAYWGAPKSEYDDAYRACCAAEDIIEETSQFLSACGERFGLDNRLGIGINKGRAFVGNVGHAGRMDYTIIGDTVNTTSRLESIAPPGRIYISRAVVDALGAQAEKEPLPPVRVKGKTGELEIFELRRIIRR